MKVGVIGLGNMGEQIAKSIIRAGLETYVYDIRPEAVDKLVEAGAQGTTSIKEVAEKSDVIGLVVLNEAQVTDCADQIAELGEPRTIVIHSTVTPGFVQKLAERLAPTVKVVDAPVAGGLARAATGDLTVMVGGTDEAVAEVQPILDAIGKDIFHSGPAGAGTAVKLSVNFTTIAGYELLMEVMEMARSYGLSEDALTTVLTTSNADSKGIRIWGFQDRVRRGGAPGTTPAQEVMLKDIKSFKESGQLNGLGMPMATAAVDALLEKVAARDAWLDEVDGEAVPRCSVCTLELAAPFRAAGVHPECAAAQA